MSTAWASRLVHSQKDPNLIVIMTDEQNFRTIGAYRKLMNESQAFPWGKKVFVETPNIDKLARQGMLLFFRIGMNVFPYIGHLILSHFYPFYPLVKVFCLKISTLLHHCALHQEVHFRQVCILKRLVRGKIMEN